MIEKNYLPGIMLSVVIILRQGYTSRLMRHAYDARTVSVYLVCGLALSMRARGDRSPSR